MCIHVSMCVCVHRIQEFSNANSLGNGGNQVYIHYLPYIHTLGFILIIWLTIILFIPYYLRDWDTRLGEVAIIQRSQRSEKANREAVIDTASVCTDLKCCVLVGFESSWDAPALLFAIFQDTFNATSLVTNSRGSQGMNIFHYPFKKQPLSPWLA